MADLRPKERMRQCFPRLNKSKLPRRDGRSASLDGYVQHLLYTRIFYWLRREVLCLTSSIYPNSDGKSNLSPNK